MTNPNTGPAESVSASRTVTPATSVTPVTSVRAAGDTSGEVFVQPSQLVRAPSPSLPDDHPQVLAAKAPPPPREAYQRAPTGNAERTKIVMEERAARQEARDKARNS